MKKIDLAIMILLGVFFTTSVVGVKAYFMSNEYHVTVWQAVKMELLGVKMVVIQEVKK